MGGTFAKRMEPLRRVGLTPSRAAAFLCVALAVAAFDWHAVMFQNRDWERLRRFGQSDDTPIHFSCAIDPAKPTYRAVRFVMDNARRGEVQT